MTPDTPVPPTLGMQLHLALLNLAQLEATQVLAFLGNSTPKTLRVGYHSVRKKKDFLNL